MRPSYDIRLAIPDDVDELLQIERECSSERETLTEEQLIEICRLDVGSLAYVVYPKGTQARILGFIVLELHAARVQIIHIAVRPSCRNKGIGRVLLQEVISNVPRYRRSQARMCVPLENMNILKWIRACQLGFQSTLEGNTVIFLRTVAEGVDLPLQGAVE